MDDSKIAQIERTITALEKNGPNWTNQMVFAHIGGSYSDLSAYLKKRRQGDVGPATRRQARVEETPASIYRRFCAEGDQLRELIGQMDPDDLQGVPVLAEARVRLTLIEERLPALQAEAEQFERGQARGRLIADQAPKWAEAAEEKTSALAEIQRLCAELEAQVKRYNAAHGVQEWGALQVCSREFSTEYRQQPARLAQLVAACTHPTEQQRAWGKSNLNSFDTEGRNAQLPLYR